MVRSKNGIAQAALFALLLAAAGLFCVFSGALQKSAAAALSLCASSVVPSLFPFMVVSSLLTQSAPFLFSGAAKRSRLFDLPAASVVALLLGAVCGFPVGVVTTAGLKRRGLLTKDQAERLAAVSNNAGPAFVVEVIGASFFGSRSFGVRLYLIEIASALILGTAYLALSARGRNSDLHGEVCAEARGQNSDLHGNICAEARIPGRARLTVIFTEAVGQATLGVIRVCGFVVFFSVVIDAVALVFPALGKTALAAVSCVLEFTSGCRLAAGVGGMLGTAMCAFAVGFSGVSVLAQSAAFAFSEGIGMKRTLLFRLGEGFLCALAAYFII